MRRRSCVSKVQRMAVEVAAGRALTGLGLRAVLRDVLAGAICSIFSVAYCLSYAALIFSGLLANWLSYGIAATTSLRHAPSCPSYQAPQRPGPSPLTRV